MTAPTGGSDSRGTMLAFEDRRLPDADGTEMSSRRKSVLRRQPYLAAIPAPISTLDFDLKSEVVAVADDASQAIARFDAEFALFPAPFAAVLLRSESASSSQIENLTSSARAIAEAEIDERREGNAALIVRNVRAMEAAIALANDISNDTIIEMQRQLLEDSHPEYVGRYRTEQVWIGGSLPQDAKFVPPHHERVPAAMDDLVEFAHRTDLPVLVQAAIAHAQFETIHPFPDGNGRTGRALVQAMLRNGGLLKNMTIPVSSGLLTDIDGYFDALNDYRAGNVAPIITVFAEAALSGVSNACTLASDIARMQEEWATRMSGLRADASARRVAALSIEFPVLHTRVVTEKLGVSQPAAGNALEALAERGVLRAANSKRRNRIWVNDEVIAALDEFAARAGRRRRSAAY
ncbi:Fic family protein [Gryllotalpicola koreensis]|uniref:Fic family protein n=2 Tax=Gryllotalpicola koreensis TaxID=993086 RepID=A0ABP8AD03_9MICO